MNRPRKKDRHLPPCVHFKHGAYYYVKAGKWNPIGKSLAEALEKYASLHEQPKGGLADLLDRAYAHHCHVEKLKPSTRSQYKTAVNTLKRKFANFSPTQVTPRTVRKLKASMSEHPNMSNRVIGFLKTVFEYAIEWGEADMNPCYGVKGYRENRRKRYISDEEFNAIYAKAGDRLQVIMDLQYLTGQRINDVLTLRRSKILETGVLVKPQKTETTSGAEVLLKWSPELRAAVERAKALSGKVPAVTLLRGRGGKAPNYRTVADQFMKAAKAAGVVDARPNDQRAKSATDAKKQGKNPRALLGHTSDAMTERYIRQHETPEVEGPSMGSIRQALDVGQKR